MSVIDYLHPLTVLFNKIGKTSSQPANDKEFQVVLNLLPSYDGFTLSLILIFCNGYRCSLRK